MYLLLKRLPDDVKGYSITTDRHLIDVDKIRIDVKRISIDARRSLFNFNQIQLNVERFYIDVKRIEIAAERKIFDVKGSDYDNYQKFFVAHP